MGAQQFEDRVSAPTAKIAFSLAVDQARHEHGHGGYTGTIAEKHEYKMVTPNAGESPGDCIRRLSQSDDHFSDDKWGAAACIDCGDDPKNAKHRVFVFFGCASS